MRLASILVLVCGLCVSIQAQDIEDILHGESLKNRLGDPFSLEGSFSLNLRSYQAWDIEDRQSPLASTVTANATVRSYGVTIPVSFIMHNLDEVEHPFRKEYWNGYLTNQRNRLARLGASPYYKWIKGHLGHRYMNFSEFTLANHNFLGAGLELTPNKWRFAAMAGRLARAEPQNLSLRTPNIQQYTRTGWGVKGGYGTSTDFIEFSMFSAKDDPRSLREVMDSVFLVTPQENLVIGIKGKVSLGQSISFQFEGAESALTRNANDPEYNSGFLLYRSFLFTRKSSTDFRGAADLKLDYSGKGVQAGLQYRRIDPGYRSLGAYFFNDDIQNITLYTGFSLFKKVLTLRLQGGIQKNNLDDSKQASFKRVIASANAAYQVSGWHFGANVNNFSSRIDYQLNPELDSLNAVVVSREANVTVTRAFASRSGITQNINFIAGMQTVNDDLDAASFSSSSEMVFANISYAIVTRSLWRWSANMDFNTNSINAMDLKRYGVGLNAGKSFLKNVLQTSAGLNVYLQASSLDQQSRMVNSFLRGSWKVLPKHTLNLQLNWISTNKRVNGVSDSYSELMGVLGYQIQFGYHPFVGRTDQPVSD